MFPHLMTSTEINLLYNLYNEPGRYYHNLNHIKFMIAKLQEFESNHGFEDEGLELKEQNNVYEYVLTAIWYHDSVYNVHRPIPNNEIDSAKLFKQWNETLGFDEQRSIVSAIERTAYHTQLFRPSQFFTVEEIALTKILLDLDLAALALPIESVKRNTNNILLESLESGIDLDTAKSNNKAFLQKLLIKDKIFYTKYFIDTCEQKARDNIVQIINFLQE